MILPLQPNDPGLLLGKGSLVSQRPQVPLSLKSRWLESLMEKTFWGLQRRTGEQEWEIETYLEDKSHQLKLVSVVTSYNCDILVIRGHPGCPTNRMKVRITLLQ